MGKKLIIVESPSKIQTIKSFLSNDYVLMASNGHVRDLPKTTLGITVDNGFEPRYKVMKEKKEVVEKLKAAAKSADCVYLATDPDREGEAIAWHLSQLLKLDESSKCRISFNEITKPAVLAAIKNKRKLDVGLIDAQQARRVLDRLVGYQISPILWHKVKSHLSAGRVQSVVVRLICDREDEIEEFIPSEYWSLDVKVKGQSSKKNFTISYHGNDQKKIKLENADAVEAVIKDCENGVFSIKDVKKTKREKHPLPPFETSSLQQDAFRKLGFSTSRTMSIAQQLYEGVNVAGKGTVGLITYMRTDSVRISATALESVRKLISKKYGEEYLPENANNYSNTKANVQDAHEAIRPAYIDLDPEKIRESLTAEQYKLYKIIYDRFVASQMKSAVYDTTNVDIKNGEHIFKVTGSILVFDGYKRIYEDEDKQESKNKLLPELNVGDTLSIIEWAREQHFTQPPSRYTEGSLVKKMKEIGIGRPSTYAPTIATIYKRNYVKKEKGSLYPTDLGILINNILIQYFDSVIDYSFTAKMEDNLDEIEERKCSWKDVIGDFYRDFEPMVKKADEDIEKIKIEDRVTDEKCEICGANMVIKMGRFGEFLACSAYPDCKFTKPILVESEYKCPVCSSTLLIKQSKKGSKFYGCSKYPECNFASTYPPAGRKCPECGDWLVIRPTKKGDTVICRNFKCKYKEK